MARRRRITAKKILGVAAVTTALGTGAFFGGRFVAQKIGNIVKTGAAIAFGVKTRKAPSTKLLRQIRQITRT